MLGEPTNHCENNYTIWKQHMWSKTDLLVAICWWLHFSLAYLNERLVQMNFPQPQLIATQCYSEVWLPWCALYDPTVFGVIKTNLCDLATSVRWAVKVLQMIPQELMERKKNCNVGGITQGYKVGPMKKIGGSGVQKLLDLSCTLPNDHTWTWCDTSSCFCCKYNRLDCFLKKKVCWPN